MPRTFALLLLVVASGCPKPVALPHGPAQPQSYKLLAEVAEAETESRTEQRPDIFVRGDQPQHVPSVVSRGEVGPLNLQGGRAQLFGDEGATAGIAVDNFLLFEVVDESGKVKHRFAVGYHTGMSVEEQEPDNVGPNSFTFEPGLDVTAQLPPEGRFTLRATALDFGGVGRVSNVYLRVSGQAERPPTDDELKAR